MTALAVITEAELAGRAEHALGVDAENPPAFDRATVGHLGAERRERHHVTDRHVERATPHVALDAVAGIDVDALHPRRVGMPNQVDDAGGDHT